jgi:dolichol kinase
MYPDAPAIILAMLLVGSVVIEIIRFKVPAVQKLFMGMVGSMLRVEENKKLTGSTYILGSAFLCTVLFHAQPHISSMVLCLFILGDAIAAVVGLSIGRIKIGKKSLEGSLACFILCIILLFGLFPHVPLLLDAWHGKVPVPLVIITSLCITVFELVPIRITKTFVINDNLSVPIIAGFVMLYLYPLFS